MIWGETGTRVGATQHQIASVAWLFSRYGISELHDGDATGFDEQCYHLGRAFRAHIVLHPPSNPAYRSYCGDRLDEVRNPKGYFERDKDVVNESEALVSVQFKSTEMDTGGTRFTTDYARSLERPIALVWPNGHISYEYWTLDYAN